jgi:hypothetical protein
MTRDQVVGGMILGWMLAKDKPVLVSDLQAGLGGCFDDGAFEGLIRDGVIEAVFPEAKPGDSGRQFWDFNRDPSKLLGALG